MIINRIRIDNFGKLEDFDLALSPGINVISSPNEWGKSTLAAFIKYIFYGFPKVRQRRNMPLGEKERHTPWTLDEIGGSITFTEKGRMFRITRLGGKSRDRVSVIDLATGQTPAEFETAEPGEVIFGVDESTFERIAFVRQFGLSVDRSDELEQKIRNLVTTGDESVSSEKAATTIEKAMSAYQHKGRRGGRIALLEDELDSLAEELRSSEAEYSEYIALCVEAAEYAADRAAATQKAAELEETEQKGRRFRKKRIYERAKSLTKDIEDQRLSLAAIRERSDRLTDENVRKTDELADEMARAEAHSKTADENVLLSEEYLAADRKKRADYLKIDAAGGVAAVSASVEVHAKRKRVLLLAAILMAAVGFILAFAGFYMTSGLSVYLFVGAGVLCAAAVGIGVARSLADGRFAKRIGYASVAAILSDLEGIEECDGAISEAVKRLDGDREKAVSARVALIEKSDKFAKFASDILGEPVEGKPVSEVQRMMAELRAEAGRISASIELNSGRLEEVLEGHDYGELAGEFEGVAVPAAPDPDETAAELAGLRSKIAGIERQEAHLESSIREKFTGVRPPVEINDDILRKSEELIRCRTELRVLESALRNLKQAADELENMLAPKLSTAVGELFAGFTGEKYDRVYIDSGYSIRIEKDAIAHDLQYFSGGTKDAAYLAFRLALYPLIFDGFMPPIIFDDSFSHMDDNRLKLILDGLGSVPAEQTLLLSCHRREAEHLRDRGNVIKVY